MREYMQSQLQHEQVVEAQLAKENEKLRGELARWQRAGSRVAEREAQVVELIRRTAGTQPAALERTYVFNAGKQPLTDEHNGLRLLVLFLCVNAASFVIW